MTHFKKGMQFTCPHCEQDSIVKLETVMDGWTKVGEHLACALCNAPLDVSASDDALTTEPKETSEAANMLLDFLGTDTVEKGEYIDDDGSRQFCRDCCHLMDHPFKIYCLLHKKDVNPMDDCKQFERQVKRKQNE